MTTVASTARDGEVETTHTVRCGADGVTAATYATAVAVGARNARSARALPIHGVAIDGTFLLGESPIRCRSARGTRGARAAAAARVRAAGPALLERHVARVLRGRRGRGRRRARDVRRGSADAPRRGERARSAPRGATHVAGEDVLDVPSRAESVLVMGTCLAGGQRGPCGNGTWDAAFGFAGAYEYVNATMAAVNAFFVESSWGAMSIAWDIPPRVINSTDTCADGGDGRWHEQAMAGALAQGYDEGAYDFYVMLMPYCDAKDWAGTSACSGAAPSARSLLSPPGVLYPGVSEAESRPQVARRVD